MKPTFVYIRGRYLDIEAEVGDNVSILDGKTEILKFDVKTVITHIRLSGKEISPKAKEIMSAQKLRVVSNK